MFFLLIREFHWPQPCLIRQSRLPWTRYAYGISDHRLRFPKQLTRVVLRVHANLSYVLSTQTSGSSVRGSQASLQWLFLSPCPSFARAPRHDWSAYASVSSSHVHRLWTHTTLPHRNSSVSSVIVFWSSWDSQTWIYCNHTAPLPNGMNFCSHRGDIFQKPKYKKSVDFPGWATRSGTSLNVCMWDVNCKLSKVVWDDAWLEMCGCAWEHMSPRVCVTTQREKDGKQLKILNYQTFTRSRVST